MSKSKPELWYMHNMESATKIDNWYKYMTSTSINTDYEHHNELHLRLWGSIWYAIYKFNECTLWQFLYVFNAV